MCQVVKQLQVPTFQTVPRTGEIPQVQFLNLSGRACCGAASPVQQAQNTVEMPSLVSDKAVDSSCATENRCHTVPQLQFIVKIVNIPVVAQ